MLMYLLGLIVVLAWLAVSVLGYMHRRVGDVINLWLARDIARGVAFWATALWIISLFFYINGGPR